MGEGQQNDELLLLLLLLGVRGLECIGDVVSLCQVILFNGIRAKRTHTTTNQKQAGIMEDSSERCHYHQGGERLTFGDDIVGSRYVN